MCASKLSSQELWRISNDSSLYFGGSRSESRPGDRLAFGPSCFTTVHPGKLQDSRPTYVLLSLLSTIYNNSRLHSLGTNSINK